MRIPGKMLGRLSAGILVFLVAVGITSPVLSADTGTYRINDYVVTLEPQSDGLVLISIEQEWEVLSGSIPWVTVGLPNDDYSVVDFGGDARTVVPDNSGSFSGVRIDLKGNHQAGSTFALSFSVLQSNLIERLPDEGIWRIDYTPGWYDRAVIGRMEVRLVSPVDYLSYETLAPQPSEIDGDTFIWQRTSLQAGIRFNVRTESMDGAFLDEDAQVVTPGGFNYGILAGILVVVAVVVFILWMVRSQQKQMAARRVRAIELEMAENELKKEEIEKGFQAYVDEKGIEPDDEGRYYDKKRGDYVTPAVWAALISTQYHRPYVGPGVNRGGTTGSGCVSCACVACACACACACAGGGAAGCARKTIHECPKCRDDAGPEDFPPGRRPSK